MPLTWSSQRPPRRRSVVRASAAETARLTFPVERDDLFEAARHRLPYLAAAAGLAWVLAGFLSADEFRVTQIEVAGNRLVPAERIAAAGQVGARNIFFVDRREIARAVLELRPVRTVAVELTLPNRLIARVAEREPAALWRVGPAAYLVSGDGVVLADAGAEAPALAIVDLEQHGVQVGDQVDQGAIEAAAYVARALPGELGIPVGHLEYSRTFGVVVPTEAGYRIVVGDAADLADKVAVLRALLPTLAERKPAPQLVDLRYKDQPYLR